MKTRITEMLGIEIPIVQAPMGWIARSRLASAVSNAGGLGPLSGERAPAVHDNEDDFSLERSRLACVEDGLQI